jgi:uncharacterized RDD family membrane protein YckC
VSDAGPEEAPVPGVARRLASMFYESLLLFAVAFAATGLFFLASGAAFATGWLRHALQAYLVAVFAAYFLWCWLRSGQTLAMKAWRIRLVYPGRERVPPLRALARFALAALLVPTGVSILWALFDRERQFLHDRLAGTRLVLLARRPHAAR